MTDGISLGKREEKRETMEDIKEMRTKCCCCWDFVEESGVAFVSKSGAKRAQLKSSTQEFSTCSVFEA